MIPLNDPIPDPLSVDMVYSRRKSLSTWNLGRKLAWLLVYTVRDIGKFVYICAIFCLKIYFFSTGCTLLFEYALVPDDPSSESDDKPYFTRRLDVPIMLTVQRPLQASNFTILPLPPKQTSDEPTLSKQPYRPLCRDLNRALSVSDLLVDGGMIHSNDDDNEPQREDVPSSGLDTASLDGNRWCLVTFDLRNISSQPFDVEFNSFGGRYSFVLFSFFVTIF